MTNPKVACKWAPKHERVYAMEVLQSLDRAVNPAIEKVGYEMVSSELTQAEETGVCTYQVKFLKRDAV